MVWQPGKKLKDGKYMIERVLGQGGFGITYLARDVNSLYSQQVAIKTLNDDVQNSLYFSKLHDDFQEEAKRLQQCTHPNIVKIYDLFLEENLFLGLFSKGKPLLCMVMEYISGNNLFEIVNMSGALPEAKALHYIKQVCEALKFIHAQNILHRDIKPDNIMLKNDETVVLIDFGIARDFIQDKTQIQTVFGTPAFSPPEQLIQQAKRGAYTDVYALAATLYFLLSGSPPQRSSGSKLKPPNELNSNISNMVNQAIIKGMEWKPEDRPQSVGKWLLMLTPKKEPVFKKELEPTLVASNKNPLVWIAMSIIFWTSASWIFLSLRISESAIISGMSVEKVAVYRSSILAFLIFPIALFAPSSEFWFKAFEKRAIPFGLLGGIIGVVISIFDNFNNFFGLTFIGAFGGLSVSFILGVPSVILGIAKRDLQIYFNELVTFIVIVGASLLGVGLGWLIFAYPLLSRANFT